MLTGNTILRYYVYRGEVHLTDAPIGSRVFLPLPPRSIAFYKMATQTYTPIVARHTSRLVKALILSWHPSTRDAKHMIERLEKVDVRRYLHQCEADVKTANARVGDALSRLYAARGKLDRCAKQYKAEMLEIVGNRADDLSSAMASYRSAKINLCFALFRAGAITLDGRRKRMEDIMQEQVNY